jgi:hypothetical protein
MTTRGSCTKRFRRRTIARARPIWVWSHRSLWHGQTMVASIVADESDGYGFGDRFRARCGTRQSDLMSWRDAVAWCEAAAGRSAGR